MYHDGAVAGLLVRRLSHQPLQSRPQNPRGLPMSGPEDRYAHGLRSAATGAHHRRSWDGTGYPDAGVLGLPATAC